MGFTINLVIINRKARSNRYYKYENHRSESSLATRLMPLTGSILLLYIIIHLLDFTLADKVGLIDGVDYGLYGLVVNTLKDPLHSLVYIISMAALSLHMFHAFQSMFQTAGIMQERTQQKIEMISKALAVGIFLGFSAIPVAIMMGL